MAFLGWPTGDSWQFNHVSRFLCFVNDTCGSYHMKIMFSFHMKEAGWVEFSVDSKYVWAIELKEVGERKLSWKLWVDHCCWSATAQWFWRKQNKALCLSTARELDFTAGSGQIGMVGNDPEWPLQYKEQLGFSVYSRHTVCVFSLKTIFSRRCYSCNVQNMCTWFKT